MGDNALHEAQPKMFVDSVRRYFKATTRQDGHVIVSMPAAQRRA